MEGNIAKIIGDVFIGRSKLLESLYIARGRLRSGEGSVILLSHEAGIGKTKLVTQFLNEVRSEVDAPVILSTQCIDITISRQPFEPFSNLLEQIAETKSTPYTQAIKRFGPKLMEGIPYIGPLFSDMLNAILDKSSPKSTPLSIGSDTVIFEYIQLLQSLARAKPMTIFIDDLQWMDALSANLLFGLARQVSKIPIMLIGNYRSDEIEGSSRKPSRPFRDVLFEIRRYKLAEILEVEFFTFDEITKYLDTVFQPNDFSPDFVKFLSRKTEGSPFFLSEMVLWLHENGYIIKKTRGWTSLPISQDIPIPDSIEAILVSRVESLEEQLHKILCYACVQGVQFRSRVLAEMLSSSNITILEQLNEISQRSLLVYELSPSDRREHETNWSFKHSLSQQTLYNSLGGALRKELHLAIAKILEEKYPYALDVLAWELSNHYRLAHHWQQSTQYGLHATKISYKAQSYIDAIDSATSALSDLSHLTMPDLINKADLYWLLSRCQAHLQQFSEAEKNANYSLDAAEKLDDRYRRIGALTRLAEVYLSERRIAELRHVYTSAWELAQAENSSLLMAYVAQFWIRDMARVLPDLTQEYCEAALQIAREQNTIPAIILALYSLGINTYRQQSYERSIHAFTEAIQIIEKTTNPNIPQVDLRDPDQFLPSLEDYSPGARSDLISMKLPVVPSISYSGIAEYCHEFIGRIHRETGHWRESISEFWKVHDSKARHGDKPGEAGLKSVISETYMMAGELETALRLHNEAITLAEAIESQQLSALITKVGIQIAANLGDMNLLRAKLDQFQKIKGVGESYWSRTLIMEMNALLALNQNKTGKATRLYQRLLTLSIKHNDLPNQIIGKIGIASCALKLGAYNQAKEMAESALQSQCNTNFLYLGEIHILLGNIAQASGDLSAAYDHLSKARQFYLEKDFTQRIKKVDQLLAELIV